jgi:hypothetical protein
VVATLLSDDMGWINGERIEASVACGSSRMPPPFPASLAEITRLRNLLDDPPNHNS